MVDSGSGLRDYSLTTLFIGLKKPARQSLGVFGVVLFICRVKSGRVESDFDIQ